MIPYPAKIEFRKGKFILNKETMINCSHEVTPVAEYLKGLIAKATGYNLTLNTTKRKNNLINFILKETEKQSNSEEYSLKVSTDIIEIKAESPQAMFHAVQTLRQLLPVVIENQNVIKDCDWFVPCVVIEDYPRFSWRGLMFDVGRHYHDIDTIKRSIDLLALMKMNIFHWHLTEDQGWRIEIKKYPKLTEIGSRREDTKIGGWTSKKYRGEPHEGYYSQEQIKEIVEYARERFITVIPEIEIPGHASAAITAYPELGCQNQKLKVPTKFGIFKDVMCPGKDSTFEFIENVLEEVIELFPSDIIHIGGDEVPKNHWRNCEKCQQRMKEEGLENEDQLQHYITKRVGLFLVSKGKRLMGWNEILNYDPHSNWIAQWWMRGKKKVRKHIQNGGDIVISSFFHLYLDYNYIVTPLKKTYSFEPSIRNLKSKDIKHILGVEAPIWTEWVPNRERLDWQVFPRLLAISEIGWSLKNNRNYKDFRKRLERFSERLKIMGVKHASLEDVDPKPIKRFWKLPFALKWPEI